MGKPAKKVTTVKEQAPAGSGSHERASGTASGRRRESARYIADLALELSNMARKSDLAFLSYLLDLASEEASAQARRF
ncbi:MAG: hypothetical protein AB7G34_13455 [Hyphomicrobiales bacterium]